jgi:hypothetical protein
MPEVPFTPKNKLSAALPVDSLKFVPTTAADDVMGEPVGTSVVDEPLNCGLTCAAFWVDKPCNVGALPAMRVEDQSDMRTFDAAVDAVCCDPLDAPP